MTNSIFRAILAAAAAASAAAASAHDFFLLPEHFTAVRTGEVRVSATVSASFPRLENVVPAERIAAIHAEGAGSPRLRVIGPAATALNLSLSAPDAGLVVAGVSALPRDVDYAEDRIAIILEEYRIGPAAVAAVERLARPRTLQVSSRRFAKTIVCAVSCADRSAAARPFGVDLEFVSVGRASDHYLLLSRGRPLPNHAVDLATSDGRRRHLSTDASGQVHLPADASGPLMLFAAVMEPPAQGQRFTLNLSSLTLERPGAGASSGSTDRSADLAAVTQVLSEYRSAIERLDASGTERLFTPDSQLFENGGVEGTYANYLAHHLGPELGHFRSFRFSDVNVEVRFEGPVALATETYTYRIERHEGEPIERRGVTTSVLRQEGSQWRIVSMHGSSRAPRRPAQ